MQAEGDVGIHAGHRSTPVCLANGDVSFPIPHCCKFRHIIEFRVAHQVTWRSARQAVASPEAYVRAPLVTSPEVIRIQVRQIANERKERRDENHG